MPKPPTEEELDLVLSALGPFHTCSSLSVGDAALAPLKTFLRKDALGLEEQSLARTDVVCDRNNQSVRAYLTLVCGEIETKDGPKLGDGISYKYESYPAIKLARLLVDSRLRGKSVGKQLADFAVGLIKSEICPRVGCRFVVVDAKRGSIGFYEKQGFSMLDTETNKRRERPLMFIELHKA